MGDGNFKWWAAIGSEPEVYPIQEDTREAAIAAARGEDGADQGFTIVEADKSVIRANINFDWIAETVMTELVEHNEECFGDEPLDPWERDAKARRDLEVALEQAVTAWLVDHPGETWALGVYRNEEYFPPVAALANAEPRS